MDNFVIRAAYDANGLAENLKKWFSEIVPGIEVSMSVWDQMAPKIIESMNSQILAIQIQRADFPGIPEADATGQEEEPAPAEQREEEKPPTIEEALVEKHDTVINRVAEYMPENTQAILLDCETMKVEFFDSLRNAISAWKKDTHEVVLMNNVTLFAMLKVSNKVKLNLNGFTIKSMATDYAIWFKEPAIIYNGYIDCDRSENGIKGGIFVSTTLVVRNLTIKAPAGVVLGKDKNEPAMLETHGMTVQGAAAVCMQKDGNILNDYGYGLKANEMLVKSTIAGEAEHKVFIHADGCKEIPSFYDNDRFSVNIRVTFL